MSQALYRKWRPQTWDGVYGQDHVVLTLRNALAAGRFAHAYLFAGPRGSGKTTTARLLAKAVNCLHDDIAARPCDQCDHCLALTGGRFLDLIEIDAASNTSVDDVRDLRDKINFSPNLGRYKVYIIDEVHMLSTAAFNALLKTLEEPPPHAIFVLATTEAHKIPATVLSRCQRHEFRRIPVVDIVACLKEIAAGENIQVQESAMTLIARQSTGAMRDAISLLDQLASSGQEITVEMAQNVLGTAASQAVLALIEALLQGESGAGFDHLHASLDAGSDPRQFARQIVDYLRQLLLIRTGNAGQVDAGAEARAQMARHAQSFETPELLRVIRVFNHAAAEARLSWQPALPLEMAFIEAMSAASSAIDGTAGAAPSGAGRPATIGSPPPSSQPPTAGPRRRASGAQAAPSADLDKEEAAPPPPPAAENPADKKANKNLDDEWPRLLKMVRRQNPTTSGLINSCKSRYFQGHNLILNFASDVLKSKMEQPENIEVVQAVVQEIFENEITILCYVDTARRDSLPPGVENDGMVAAAMRDLGGEIVDIQ